MFKWLRRLQCTLWGHEWTRSTSGKVLLLRCCCGATSKGWSIDTTPRKRFEGDAERHRLRTKSWQ